MGHVDSVSNAPHTLLARRGKVPLSEVDETFKTYFSGQGNMLGPPSGYFGGYAVNE